MDINGYLRFVLALIFVLGMIGLLALLVRRFAAGSLGIVPRRKGAARRIRIVETLAVDARRRVVLIRRDDREHLILLGAGSEVVIERDIPLQDPPAHGTASNAAPRDGEP